MAVSNSLVNSADDLRNQALDALFAPSESIRDIESLKDEAAAFMILAEQCITLATKNGCYKFDDLRFDEYALRLMLLRFQRDAFGVSRLWSFLDASENSGDLKPDINLKIKELIQDSGLRINSPAPKKTRIAAAFSLWMCMLRPVYVDKAKTPINEHGLLHGQFCAFLNLWMTTQYLSKFGTVKIGNEETQAELIKRIYHDFTFRDVNLSSMEVFYCSIFTPRDLGR
jgi:hypothetical protein